MQLDPTRWLVAIAGFIYDWIITREWTKILLASMPVFLCCALAGFVFWGSRQSKIALAQWYMEQGNAEIEDWENSWADSEKTLESTDDNESDDLEDSGSSLEVEGAGDEEDSREVSAYAEALFRRAQLLYPSDRSQWVVGTSLAQKGAVSQAETILTQIAPNDAEGYPQAHAVLSELLYPRIGTDQQKYLPIVMHHMRQAAKWSKLPLGSLRRSASLFAEVGKTGEALSFLATAADRDPVENVNLARLAAQVNDDRLVKKSTALAEEHLKAVLAEDPKDQLMRITLATLYVDMGRIKEAHDLLFAPVEGLVPGEKYIRARSEIYRIMFQKSIKLEAGNLKAEMNYLDRAFSLDQTNPNVAQEVAKLARMQRDGSGRLKGPSASPKLIAALQQFLTKGQATTVTHALLAETYLLDENYKLALPHLEQVVQRLPNQYRFLNNLAFVLAEIQPDRMEEALEYAKRSVVTAARSRASNADFYDTLAMIHQKMGNFSAGITAIENAISMTPTNVGYHERAADLYDAQGTTGLADLHREQAKQLEKAEGNAAATPAVLDEEALESTQPDTNAETEESVTEDKA